MKNALLLDLTIRLAAKAAAGQEFRRIRHCAVPDMTDAAWSAPTLPWMSFPDGLVAALS
ncbi:MAG TPA: hypothetical protein PLR28_10135 [Dokdonella sp.]|nr:hypothetical protein [Dokdonella sp.]